MTNSITGHLSKMQVVLAEPVEYVLLLSERDIAMHTLLSQKITLRYTGRIQCVQCGRKTNKSFQQGHCFPCYRQLLACNLCVIHPEKCTYYEGKCDPNDWAHAHCGQKHIVYLANSSGLKVGITRDSQIPVRWIDQGATQGLPIFSVENRYQAGMIEVALKKYIADKTNWQAMLKADHSPQDLFAGRNALLLQAQDDLAVLIEKFSGEVQYLSDMEMTQIRYPVLKYPKKISAFNLDKNPVVEGVLEGIKGQYLILDTGVLNIRKYSGYEIELSHE